MIGMTNERIENDAKRVREIVDILQDNGVDVYQWNPVGGEYRDDGFCDDSFCWFNRMQVHFHGDENEGLRAIEIGKQNGFQINYLSRGWTVHDKGEILNYPVWTARIGTPYDAPLGC